MTNDMVREVREAIDAGERALQSLRRAQDELNSAGNWGIVDMLGGGLLTTLVKHSKMDNAVSYMETAKSSLHTFQRELRDVSVHTNFNLEIGSFLNFADYFFDGIVADYLVQSRINDAKNQVSQAIGQVEHILRELRRL